MKCPKCHRLVVSDHECDGDARSTCSIYGCGRPNVAWYPTDVSGTGHTVRLGRCSVHSLSALVTDSGAAIPASKPPIRRTTEEEMREWNAHIEETWLAEDSNQEKRPR